MCGRSIKLKMQHKGDWFQIIGGEYESEEGERAHIDCASIPHRLLNPRPYGIGTKRHRNKTMWHL